MAPPSLSLHMPNSPTFYAFRRSSFSGKCLDSIEEERPSYHVNLGVESPSSIMNDGIIPDDSLLARAGIAVNTNVPARTRSWRSLSFVNKTPSPRSTKERIDRDCGICFEHAVVPYRALCCGKMFCLEHIANWLHGSPSDGRCPSCETRCIFEKDTMSLATPPLRRKATPPSPLPSRFSRRSSGSPPSKKSSDTSSEPESESHSDDEGTQACVARLDHLSEDALPRILGKVVNLVALMIIFYALLSH